MVTPTSSPRRGRPPSPGKAAAILDAATDVFLREGFAGTNLDVVAAAAGVSKQTVYSRFGDKERLFLAAVDHARATGGPPEHLPDLAGAVDLAGALRDFVRRHLELTQRPRVAALRRLMIAELARRPWLQERWGSGAPEAAFAHLGAQFGRLHAAGVLDTPDPERAAHHLVAVVSHEAAQRSLYGVRPLTPGQRAELAAEAVELFLRAYRVR